MVREKEGITIGMVIGIGIEAGIERRKETGLGIKLVGTEGICIRKERIGEVAMDEMIDRIGRDRGHDHCQGNEVGIEAENGRSVYRLLIVIFCFVPVKEEFAF